MRSVEVSLGNRSYPIHIDHDMLRTNDLLRQQCGRGEILIVSDERVAPLYLEQVQQCLGENSQHVLILPEGEETKNVANWQKIIDELIRLKAGRDACLIALGGGVIGDLCGFAAATFMRGIRFLQVPTTLLAQVDASVGGKTAINHPLGKNLVGAFHQPIAVLADTSTLSTLSARHYRAGLAEVIKYGLIRDAKFLVWLEQNVEFLRNRDPEKLAEVIEICVRNKAEVVAADELEQGSRALLNFGHTFGHALESLTGYQRLLHGEAVAIGMVIACRLSEARGLCPAGLSERASSLLVSLGLPITLPGGVETGQILSAMTLDKKNEGGQLRLVLLNDVGQAVLDSGSTEQEIRTAIIASR